jgi:RNA polymerase sigma factor (sigma-70 family)
MPGSIDFSDRERLARAARTLTRVEREVLVLSARDGLWNQEIAERLGFRVARVERILARALRKLDRALQEEVRP